MKNVSLRDLINPRFRREKELELVDKLDNMADKITDKYVLIENPYKSWKRSRRMARAENERQGIAEEKVYRQTHSEKRRQLEAEKATIEIQIQKLQKDYEANPQKKEMERTQREIAKNTQEMQSCGIFQLKRKKELAATIKALQKKERTYSAAFERITAEYKENMEDLQKQLKQVNRKLDREWW